MAIALNVLGIAVMTAGAGVASISVAAANEAPIPAVQGAEEPCDAGAASASASGIMTGQTEECPDLRLEKTADTPSVVVGGVATYTITVWNRGPGTALDVVVEDTIPAGWTFDGSACDEIASSTEGGEESWSCTVYELEASDMAGGMQITVSGPTGPGDCGALTNTATATAANVGHRIERTATVSVTCPTLTLDKQADADLITISDGSAAPAIVTWTLSWTVAGGSVTNAMIVDQLPEGFTYVDASATDGGVHDELTNTMIWVFPTLSDSGSVTFQTSVDPVLASRQSSAVNVAFIGSDQTPMAMAEAQIAIALEQELGGNPTPTPDATPVPAGPTTAPDLPDTAVRSSPDGPSGVIGVILLSLAAAVMLDGMAPGGAFRTIRR